MSHPRPRALSPHRTPKNPRLTALTTSPHFPASQTTWTEADDLFHSNKIIDSTQTSTPATQHTLSYGIIPSKIVGIRYYSGITTPGETLILRREPSNQYDRNAIRADNVNHIQVGHVPATLAKHLAPLVDQGMFTLEGVVKGFGSGYDLPVTFGLFGPSQGREELERALKEKRIPALRRSEEQIREEAKRREMVKHEKERVKMVIKRANELARLKKSGQVPKGTQVAVEPERGPGVWEGLGRPMVPDGMGGWIKPAQVTVEQTYEQLVGQAELLNPREIGGMVNKFGVGEENLEKMEMAKQPRRLKTQLLPYQLQGLAWLLKMEHPQMPKGGDDIVQLWKLLPNNTYQNVGTRFTTREKPAFASGGILADDMGLGKTIQIISLITTDIAQQKELVPNPTVNGTDCETGTLIVAPLSVMSNWTGQMIQHVKDDAPLKVYVYHGPNHSNANLADYDVVITSYGTMVTEFNPSAKTIPKSGLFSKKWRRVVLDEAHQIRNPKSKSSLAATALRSLSHWCLSGTPIVNSLKDFYSLLKFMKYPGGLADLEIFNRILYRPVQRGDDPAANQLLKIVVATLCMRRTKDMKFVDLRLPEFKSMVHRVTFSLQDQERYDVLEAEAKGVFSAFKDGKKGATYNNVLELLLRMRQVCNHHALCGERLVSLMKLAGQDRVELNEETKAALQDLLQLRIDAQEDCSICLETLHDPRITVCKHAFGKECIEKVIELQQKCPMCRAPLADSSLLVEPFVPLFVAPPPPEDTTTSSKTTAIIEILTATAAATPKRKTVIFSQWSSFHDLLAPMLTAASLAYTRLNGSPSATARDDSIAQFANDDNCTVMLATYGVASVGLNLTMASQVVLADSWWAPAVEDQAVDRVYRLGQKEGVVVWRVVVGGSVEERVLDVQKVKRELVEKAFGEKKKGKGRGGDLQTLLG